MKNQKNTITPEYMSMQQASEYLGFSSYKSIYNYIAQGLPVIVLNGSKRISKTAIDEFMKSHELIKGNPNVRKNQL